MGGQARRQVAHQCLTSRHRRELVHVIDDDADVHGGHVAQRIEYPVDVAAPSWRGTETRQDRRRQATSILVTGFTRDPGVNPSR